MSRLWSMVAASGVLAAMLAGCGGNEVVADDTAGEPVTETVAEPRSESDNIPNEGDTTVDAGNGGVSFSFTDRQGYTFDVVVSGIDAHTSIENAAPGETHLKMSGSARVTNTTPGRNAPANGFQIDMAIPHTEYCPDLTPIRCPEGFLVAEGVGTLWNPDSYGAQYPTAAEGETYELRMVTEPAGLMVPESVSLDGGFWFRLVGSDKYEWVAARGVEGPRPPDDF